MRSTRLATLWILAACTSSAGSRSVEVPRRADTTLVVVDARRMPTYDGSPLDNVPTLLTCPPVRYPETVRLARVQGRVVLEFVLDTLGRAEAGSIEAIETPHDSLTIAARETLLRCRFTPARVRGRGVSVLLQLPWDFALKEPRP